jgi:diguanylate cyclase (GGDEF)-like protein/PAS domain S-box-containing protein
MQRARVALARMLARRRAGPHAPPSSVAILQAQQEATLDGILVVDTQGGVLSYNRRFLVIWGIPEGVAATADDNVFLGYAAELVEDWDAFIAIVNHLYEHPDETRTEDPVALKDGRVLARASVPVISDGRITGRAWYFRDITEAKKAETLQAALFRIAQLSRETENLDAFYASVHQIVGSLMDATNFYIAEYNPEQNILMFPYFVDQFDEMPMGLPPGGGLTSYVLRTGEPLLARPSDFESLQKDGLVQSIGAPSVDWLGVPLKSGDRSWGVIGVQSYDLGTRYSERHREILVFVAQHVASAIEHRRKEDALRASELRYRQMFENNRAVQLLLHPDSGRIIDANMAACDFYGYTREELLAMCIWDINVLGEEGVRRELENAKLQERSYFIFRHRRASGEVRDVEVHSGPVDVGSSHLLYSIIHDITERKRAEETLRTQSTAMTASMDGIGILDELLHFTYLNDALAKLYGYRDTETLLGRPLFDLYEADEKERLMTQILPAVQQRGRWRGEANGRKRDGTAFPQEISITSIDAGGVVCVVRDITERTYAEEQIKHLAYHDALTGLPNRLLFKDRLTVALSHAQRERTRLAILFLDLDRFKVINDSLGHNIGDQLLQAVAARVSSCVRESDTVARLGGDEFTLLLPNLLRSDDAAPIAQKILEAVRYPFHIEGREFFITTSIGISLYPEDGTDAETLIKNADTAMYQAKEQGRDNYQLFNAFVNAKALQRIALEHGLHRALQNDELEVHYQPIFDFRSGRITGMEALLRWTHPDMGVVPPAVFIPIAEATGTMVPIGLWAMRRACEQAKTWHDSGFRNLSLAVNLSVTQLQQADLVPRVQEVLTETGLPPRLLELEITESSAMQSPEGSIRTLYELKKLGIRISLDDFGTGHSSLSYLKRFPIDTLKIDQSFVRDITNDPDTAAIVTAIIAMAHSLRLKVIAEGVEFTDQANFLKRYGCDQMQGYLIRAPVPAAEFFEMISQPA